MEITETRDGRKTISAGQRDKLLRMVAEKTGENAPTPRPYRTDLQRSTKKRNPITRKEAENQQQSQSATTEQAQQPWRKRPPTVDAFALMPDGAAGVEIPAPMYPSMFDFVMCELVSTYGQSLGRVPNWSAVWYRHPEAVRRLDALWRKFEKLRVDDPFGFRETFYHRHADYHMDRLMKPEGVFSDCKRDDVPMQPLPTAQMKTTYVKVSKES